MADLRQRIRVELDVKATIVPKVEIRQRVEFLKDYLRSTPARGYVLGVSGGQDSTLTGRLCQLAGDCSGLKRDGMGWWQRCCNISIVSFAVEV